MENICSEEAGDKDTDRSKQDDIEEIIGERDIGASG